MGCFSRSASARASAKGPCVACCQAEHAQDDQIARTSSARIAALTARRGPANAAPSPATVSGSPSGRVNSDCAQKARSLAPVVQRFDRYRRALPSARAAADLSDLGDAPGDAPSTQPCLTRLPVQADKLNQTLGLPPGRVRPEDLRNDQTGFRAAMYRDNSTGRLILVPRDTQPDSLVDWQTNTRNGVGLDTPQYSAMRTLTRHLQTGSGYFDIAGYSKGGGLAQEGGLVSTLSQVRVFNSAGLPDNALRWTDQTSFANLVARTQSFSAQGDFLTFMNDTTDPGQNIANARFLQRELAGQASGPDPIAIKVRDPAMRGVRDTTFTADKQAYIDELGRHIDDMQTAYDTGAAVPRFPPVRAASRETVDGSMTELGRLLGAQADQPTLGKLAQHKMSAVLDAMERDVATDRASLSSFLASCG